LEKASQEQRDVACTEKRLHIILETVQLSDEDFPMLLHLVEFRCQTSRIQAAFQPVLFIEGI
jgi:hypothetical protein